MPPIDMNDYGCYGQLDELTLASVPGRLESYSFHDRKIYKCGQRIDGGCLL